ncbi:MAG: hypothetical protein ACYTXY_35475, partial [Nostoc sp.]
FVFRRIYRMIASRKGAKESSVSLRDILKNNVVWRSLNILYSFLFSIFTRVPPIILDYDLIVSMK